MITDLLLFSITPGRTVKTGGKLASPFGNTLIFEHSTQVTLTGACIASFTSLRSKYRILCWSLDVPLTGKISSVWRRKSYVLYIKNLRKPEHIPQNGVLIEDTVNVEGRVNYKSGIENLIPDITSWICRSVCSGERKGAFRGESNIFIYISRIVAPLRSLI